MRLRPVPGDAVEADGFVAEVAEGEFVEAVAVGAGGLGVGDEHGVVDWGDMGDAGVAEDHEVVFGVLQDFEDGGVSRRGGRAAMAVSGAICWRGGGAFGGGGVVEGELASGVTTVWRSGM